MNKFFMRSSLRKFAAECDLVSALQRTGNTGKKVVSAAAEASKEIGNNVIRPTVRKYWPRIRPIASDMIRDVKPYAEEVRNYVKQTNPELIETFHRDVAPEIRLGMNRLKKWYHGK